MLFWTKGRFEGAGKKKLRHDHGDGVSSCVAFCAVRFIVPRTSAVVIIILPVIVASIMIRAAARKALEFAKAPPRFSHRVPRHLL